MTSYYEAYVAASNDWLATASAGLVQARAIVLDWLGEKFTTIEDAQQYESFNITITERKFRSQKFLIAALLAT